MNTILEDEASCSDQRHRNFRQSYTPTLPCANSCAIVNAKNVSASRDTTKGVPWPLVFPSPQENLFLPQTLVATSPMPCNASERTKFGVLFAKDDNNMLKAEMFCRDMLHALVLLVLRPFAQQFGIAEVMLLVIVAEVVEKLQSQGGHVRSGTVKNRRERQSTLTAVDTLACQYRCGQSRVYQQGEYWDRRPTDRWATQDVF